MAARLVVSLGSFVFAAPALAGPAQPITFTRDIAPILQDKCEACHRPDSMAPMPLRTYEEVRPWARAIKQRVAARQMPPWHIDRTVGIQRFENDRSLTDEQIDAIIRWVDAGAPQGDPNDMPPPRRWPDDSVWAFAERFGPPDLIIRSPRYVMPAHGQDAWWKPVVPTGLTEPRWVRAIEIRPTTAKARRITHHAVARLLQDDGNDIARAPSFDIAHPPFDADTIEIGPGLFMEWAVGKQGEIMRPNTGKLMLPGSKIVWDIHYHAVGEEIPGEVELAVYFYPKGQEPKYRTVLGQLQAIPGGSKQNLDIPPNSIAVHQGLFVMRQAGRIENFQPHMHLRGKAMSMEAILPNGETRMLSLANFEFNWHLNYIYAADAAPILPKGTILRFTAWHDNTAANKANPDPNQWVGWGERTVDEMAHAWVNITYMSDEDYRAELAKRGPQAASVAAR